MICIVLFFPLKTFHITFSEETKKGGEPNGEGVKKNLVGACDAPAWIFLSRGMPRGKGLRAPQERFADE